jgi:hypothetical protein
MIDNASRPAQNTPGIVQEARLAGVSKDNHIDNLFIGLLIC